MDKYRWQRIQALFAQLADLAPGAREAQLRAACAGDDALYREVASLLDADAASAGFLQGLDLAGHGGLAPLAQPGRELGPYRILGTLGSGGMGVVFKALDQRLDRPVALKMLPLALNHDRWARDRFIAEAKAASSLDHPNICTIFEIDCSPGGQWYMAMGCYEGGTLAARLGQGALAVPLALQVAVQLARGLDCAHASGIYHRDVKPANILFSVDDVVKIADFGIAKIAGKAQTLTGLRLGTVAYMAPEQYRGEAVDQRADIWALGVVLYEMLAGRTPFGDEHPHAVMQAVATRPPPLSELRSELPATIDRLIARALAPDPAQRYPRMGEFLADLEALAGALGQAGPAAETAGRTVRRPRHLGPGRAWSANDDLRQVTVVCVGLADQADVDADPEALQRRGAWLQRAVSGPVGQYRGTVVAQLDDEVTAVFGAPVAHDNDPQRAVRCALQLLEAARPPAGDPVAIAVGIASGQVLVSGSGPGGCKVTGAAVQLARRLKALAGSDQLVASEEVKQAVQSWCRCVAGPTLPLTAAGPAAPLWRITGYRPQAETGAGQQLLVGRERQLRQFGDILHDCRVDGRGQVVYVRGEAGIGKTRLVEAFRQQAVQTGFLACTGLVLDFGVAQGQDAIAVVIRRLIEQDAGAAADSAAPPAALVEPAQQVFLNDLLGLCQPESLRTLYEAMDHGRRRRGLLDTLAQVLRRSAQRQPLLILIEDLHWADGPTLELLAEMAKEAAEGPILMVLTSRSERDPLDAVWRARVRGPQFVTFDLAPLRTAEARAMARAVSRADEPYIEDCVQRAAGNPLFLAQLLRSAEQGRDGRVPPSLQSLVIARLDQLPAADKRALRAAAVIGQRFDLETLRFLLDDPIYDCAALLLQGLLRSVDSDYLFAHALILDAVYLSLPASDQRLLHGRAAEWFAERDPALTAEHLERAADPAAVAAYLHAARARMQSYQFDRALQLVERAARLPHPRAEQYAIHRLRGEIEENLGEMAAAMTSYQAALDSAVDDLQLCQAWIGLASGHDVADRPEAALQTLDQAQAAVGSDSCPLELSKIHYLRGNLFFPRGDVAACRAQHELALQFARAAGCPESEARALSGLGDAEYASGRMGTAYRYFQRCLALCEAHGLGRIEAANRFMLGTVRIYQNETQAALRDSLDAAEAAARVGHVRAEIVSRLTAGWILYGLDRLDAAWTQAEQGLRLAQGLGARRFEPFLEETLARIEDARGERAAAHGRMRQAFALALQTGPSFIGPWLAGTLALTSPDPAGRDRALAQGAALLEQGAVGHNYFRFYLAAMERTLADADWDLAEGYANQLAAYTAPEPTPWSDYFIAWTRALARCGRGEQGAALRAELTLLRRTGEAAGLVRYLGPLDLAIDDFPPQ